MHRMQHTYAEFEITLTCTLLKIPHNRPFFSPKVTADILLHKPFFNVCIYLVFRTLLKEGS